MPAHFEIHAADVDAAKAFYNTVLGWTFDPMPGGEEIGYHLIMASEIGPGKPLSGGLLQRPDAIPAKGSSIRGCTLTFTFTLSVPSATRILPTTPSSTSSPRAVHAAVMKRSIRKRSLGLTSDSRSRLPLPRKRLRVSQRSR